MAIGDPRSIWSRIFDFFLVLVRSGSNGPVGSMIFEILLVQFTRDRLLQLITVHNQSGGILGTLIKRIFSPWFGPQAVLARGSLMAIWISSYGNLAIFWPKFTCHFQPKSVILAKHRPCLPRNSLTKDRWNKTRLIQHRNSFMQLDYYETVRNRLL